MIELKCPKCGRGDMKEFATRFKCRSCKYEYEKNFSASHNELHRLKSTLCQLTGAEDVEEAVLLIGEKFNKPKCDACKAWETVPGTNYCTHCGRALNR